MRINSISLKNYRNHENFRTEFDKDLTFITGPNSAGKTNILEAIHLLSTTKSLRAKFDRDLINIGKDFCTVSGDVTNTQDDYSLEIQVIKSGIFENAASKKVKVSKVPKTVQNFCGIFNSVIFTPEDIQLLIGSPSERRKYIDAILIQTDNLYKKASAQYTKALRQRNKILETINRENNGRDLIDFWTQEILTQGTLIQDRRKELFERLSVHLNNQARNLESIGTSFTVEYKMNEISEARLWEYRHKEIATETTLVGPHRDDFEIFFNDKNVGQFGSRGQQRSIILALKLAEIEFITEKTSELPVLLLDDIFSELDIKHRKAVTDAVEKQQTIITSADDNDFIDNIEHKLIELTL